jgi:membrane protease YdiL (CAAX protease family)
MTQIQRFITQNSIQTGIILLLIALVFRVIDIFVLKLDERWGEIILSKTLGFILVCLFLWTAGKNLGAIGFHRANLGRGLFTAVLFTALPFLIAYLVEIILLRQSGHQPRLAIRALDPKAGVAGGLLFALFLLAGNFINSFMEEGLFRGVMLDLFQQKLSFLRANWLQALLFGAWHLVWAVKLVQTGQASSPGEISMAVIANFVPQVCLGLVWAFAYMKTGNLWTAWTMHTLTNTTLNFVHVSVAGGLDPGMTIRMITFTVASLLMMLFMR